MKSFITKLSGIASFILFPVLFLFLKRKKMAYIVTGLIMITLSSCFLTFFKTNTQHSIDAGTVTRLSSENRYFIIHFSNSTNGLENITTRGDSIYGKIVPLPPQHSKYLHPDYFDQTIRMKAADKPIALVEVHLYTNAQLNMSDSLFSTNLSSINRADVYELNKSATTTNHILSITGIVLISAALVSLIAFAIACNCPQVYVDNNGSYNFAGGLYSGAVYSTLERTDYLPLNIVLSNQKDISFKIANVKDEEQFINKVELLQINHMPGTSVLADRHGNIFSYSNFQMPLSATTNGNDDLKNVLQQRDDNYYSFENNANKNGFSDVRLTFNKPANAENVKLVINARNTYWGALLHKEFINLFGEDFEKWRQIQEKANPKDLEKWQTDQALPLMVYIKTNEGWKFVDYFQLIGNTASRDMIMNIDVKNIPGNKIELKLETAYRLWDVDFAGIDFSSNENITKTILEPAQAIKSDSTNEKETLRSNDKQYVHLVNDEFITFRYAAPQSSNNTQSSYFLVSSGYYHNHWQAKGKADYGALIKFRKPGTFDKFSREKYKQAQDVAAIMQGLNNKK